MKLTPLTKEEEFLSRDHEVMVTDRIVTDNYGAGGAVKLVINLFWGVKGLDNSKSNKWDTEYIGEVIWDEQFDLTPKENQQNILDFCTELKGKDFLVESSAYCWTD